MDLFRPHLPARLAPAVEVLQVEIQHQTAAIAHLEVGADDPADVLTKVKNRTRILASCNDLLETLSLPAVRLLLAERERTALGNAIRETRSDVQR